MRKVIPSNKPWLKILIDDEDYDEVNKYSWTLHRDSNHAYANINGYICLLGRFILNYDGPLDVDHKDVNVLNYQKDNLRLATRSQNNANQNKKSNTSSKYKGVTWVKNRSKWQSSLKINGRSLYLGSYSSEKAAAHAYNKAAIVNFGEFARVNRFENEE